MGLLPLFIIPIIVALPDDVKKRLYVVHTTNSQVPIDKGLKAAPVGVQVGLRC